MLRRRSWQALMSLNRSRHSIVLGATLSVFCIGAAPPRHIVRPKPIVLAFNPATYAARVAELNSCDDLKAKVASVPDATANLLRLGKIWTYNIPPGLTKSEFETTPAYQERLSTYWQRELGDTHRVLVRSKKGHLEYDADKGIMRIKYLFNYAGQNSYHLEFNETDHPTSHYAAQNSFGATANVTSYTQDSNFFVVDDSDVKKVSSNIATQDIEIPMTVDIAKKATSSPNILIWAEIHEPYLKTDSSHSDATISSPSELHSYNRAWAASLKCVLLMNGNEVVADLYPH
jgi:hypothetical protein